MSINDTTPAAEPVPAELVDELVERLQNARDIILDLSKDQEEGDHECVRLQGKAEGIILALDYIRMLG